MTIQDDETLQMYLEESIEHLADIETDLLAIEEAGADIDEDIVNMVYRAAHSIKGGAGFMGLTTIKDLTHEMENILGKIRSRDMIPTPEIINVLLMASDTLKALMNDVFTSNDVDISQHIDSLQAIAEGKPLTAAAAPQQEAPATVPPATAADAEPDLGEESEKEPEMVSIAATDADFSIDADRAMMEGLMKEGKFVYLAKIDLMSDVVEKGKQPGVAIEEMEQTGTLIACSIAPDNVRSMQLEKGQAPEPLIVLFATILKPEDINVLFEIPDHQIHQIMPDLSAQCLGSPSPEPVVADHTPEPEAVVQPEPTPTDRPAATETESENTRSLRVLRYHGQRTSSSTLLLFRQEVLAKVAQPPQSPA